jgi:hypothetical protein
MQIRVDFKTSPTLGLAPAPVIDCPFTVNALQFTDVELKFRQERSPTAGEGGMDPNEPHELLRIRPVAVRSTHCSAEPIFAVPVVVRFPWTSTADSA